MYVDALFDNKKNKILVVERRNGKRIYEEYPAKYRFYYDDPKGSFTTVYGTQVAKFETRDQMKFRRELTMYRGDSQRAVYESDINPLNICLEENYYGAEQPELNIGFFDIEVDFDPVRGYANPEDPFMMITAISVHCTHIGQTICLTIPPKGMSEEESQGIADKFNGTVILFDDERELLKTFLDIIEDCDILSGWNSAFFDIPYIIGRIVEILGSDYVRKLCLWGQKPKRKTVEKFGKEQLTFDLVGRVHLDYLDLYKKHSMQELHSYKLDYVGEIEVKRKKVEYEGTLHQLYNDDFEKFIDYSIQDTDLLVDIDKKNQYIDLANAVAHTNTVLLKATLGTVQVVEQAIINEAHQRGMVVMDKANHGDTLPVAGAYVADPVVGMHEEIGAIDINSLYPSVIRALNMGPETIVGQIELDQTAKHINDLMAKGISGSDAWHDMFGTIEFQQFTGDRTEGPELSISFEDGNVLKGNIETIKRWIWSNQVCISANGTLFATDRVGVIAGILGKWYNERVEMRAKVGEYKKLVKEEDDPVKKAEYNALVSFWDKRQYVRKILLNSLYGALLNSHCRFYDPRIGQSVTLTGRCITRHMIETTNELITGKRDKNGDGIIYGDTDSCYFSAVSTMRGNPDFDDFSWDKENVIELYDAIADGVNDTFINFMVDTFHTTTDRGGIIEAGRELVASRGMFIKKKRYALMIYDDEGFRIDKVSEEEAEDKGYVYGFGKIKAMGVETKRTDTSKEIQKFLEQILEKVLSGNTEQEVLDYIKEFRGEFKKWPGWLKGTPKGVNGLTKYGELATKAKGAKVNMPGHVRAAMNWNTLKKLNDDLHSLTIMDGFKTVVCKLRPNQYNMTSIGFPVDEPHLPKWFKELPFDDDTMDASIIEKKLQNLIGILKWDLDSTKQNSNFSDLFGMQKK